MGDLCDALPERLLEILHTRGEMRPSELMEIVVSERGVELREAEGALRVLYARNAARPDLDTVLRLQD